MHRSKQILSQIEEIDSDAFSYLPLITYLHVSSKKRKLKKKNNAFIWCANLVIFCLIVLFIYHLVLECTK